MSPELMEIERKFLVRSEAFREGASVTQVAQAYLAREGEVAVRVRIRDGRGTLTVKARQELGKAFEWERDVPLPEAQALIENAASTTVIAKRRHVLVHARHTWEVDVFEGANAGLIVAEIELEALGEAFIPPPWLGPEVTHDDRFFNARLVDRPFSTWGQSYSELLAECASGIRSAPEEPKA